jgi:hypothetical protein
MRTAYSDLAIRAGDGPSRKAEFQFDSVAAAPAGVQKTMPLRACPASPVGGSLPMS